MAVRKVRTAAGVERYDQPIGSIIVADSVLRSLKVTGTPYKGWTRVKGTNGKEYDIGQDEDANVWVALEPDTWEIVVDEGDTEEEVFTLLNKNVTKKSGPTPDDPVIGTAIDKPAPKKAAKKAPTAKKTPVKKAENTPKKVVAKKQPAKKTTTKKMTPAKKTAPPKKTARAAPRRGGSTNDYESMSDRDLQSLRRRAYQAMFERGHGMSNEKANKVYNAVSEELRRRSAEKGDSGKGEADSGKGASKQPKKKARAKVVGTSKPTREQISEDVRREMSRKPQGMTTSQRLSEEAKRDIDTLPFEQRDRYLNLRDEGKSHEDAYKEVTGFAPPRLKKQYDGQIAKLQKQLDEMNAERVPDPTKQWRSKYGDTLNKLAELKTKRGGGSMAPTTAQNRAIKKLGQLDQNLYWTLRRQNFTHEEAMTNVQNSGVAASTRKDNWRNQAASNIAPENSKKVKASELQRGDTLIIQGTPQQRVELTGVRTIKGKGRAVGTGPDMIEVSYASPSGGETRRYRADTDLYVVDKARLLTGSDTDYGTWSDERLRRMLASQTLKPTRRKKMEAELRRRANQRDLEREIKPDVVQESRSIIDALDRLRGVKELTDEQIQMFDNFTVGELGQRATALRNRRRQLKTWTQSRSETSAERQRWEVEMREAQNSINQLNAVIRARRSNR